MLYAYTRAEASPIPIVFTANQVGPSDLHPDVWGDVGKRLCAKLSATPISEEMLASGAADDIIASVSPAYHIDGDTVPSIFAYGGKDTLVTKENGESLRRAFDAAGVEYEYVYFENSDHALLGDPLQFIRYYVLLDEYCERFFGY